MSEARRLEKAARRAGLVLFVDTDVRLKCYGVKLLMKNPELRKQIIAHRFEIAELIRSRSL